jgi:hypothetical protein
VAERGIIFSAPMVRALLAFKKTQTRRIVKNLHVTTRHKINSDLPSLMPSPEAKSGRYTARMNRGGAVTLDKLDLGVKPGEFDFECPYVQGTTHLTFYNDGRKHWTIIPSSHHRLWVREGFAVNDPPSGYLYRADYEANHAWGAIGPPKWKTPIFMPRQASRIELEVSHVIVQRLHDITEDDARDEGMEIDDSPCDHTRQLCSEIGCLGQTYRSSYASGWDAINGEGSWESNPLVWVITFAVKKGSVCR